MTPHRYAVNSYPVQVLLNYAQTGEIAIPEIQRPFVWDAVKVRNLLDSLYQGFPIGYLIAWRNPDVKLKDGSSSHGKRVLIDGQQRVSALMAALLGHELVTRDYERVRIRIAFHPVQQKFEVWNPLIARDPGWIADISEVFRQGASLFAMAERYCQLNPQVTRDEFYRNTERLRNIVHNQVGIIELDPGLDIETVTEIFIRVNSAGTALSQADFAMSRIASNEAYGGGTLRKAIDYFCHLAVHPEFHETLRTRDPAFAATDYFQKMSWLRHETDDIYDPSYSDLLRVAFTSEFRRGRIEDLVALLSGRNFETKQFEEEIAERSFAQLRAGVLNFINETNFKNFLMVIRSAGFVDSSLIGSVSALNFAYILYLTLKKHWPTSAEFPKLQSAVRRWFVMSVLTGRYSGSTETKFDEDIRQIDRQGFDEYTRAVIPATLSGNFWTGLLPQQMNTSSAQSPYFKVYLAAQVKLGDKGFLSDAITVHDLISLKSDMHHIFPASLLKRAGVPRNQYNQIANFAPTPTEINIAIGHKAPSVYFRECLAQCNGGPVKYGGITDLARLRANLAAHCIPEGIERMGVSDYEDFLRQRRVLMARKIAAYFATL